MLPAPPPYRTDHPDDAGFIDAFERGTLPLSEWCHAAHVRMAWIYLSRSGLEQALGRARDGIKAYNLKNGVPEAPLSGYHETLTNAWLRVVEATRRSQDPCATSMEFLEAQPHLRVRTLLRLYYSKARMLSPEAKSGFVPPDLAPLP